MTKRKKFKNASNKKSPPLTEVTVKVVHGNGAPCLEFFGRIDGNASVAQADDCFEAARKFSSCILHNHKLQVAYAGSRTESNALKQNN